jgi:purine-binding chemotaxis protein CheW
MSELAIAGHSELAAGDEEQLVTMTVDGQLFGIPILRVQDIVEPKQITTVPLASAAVAGVLNLRGRIVTVIDLRVCLGAEPKDLADRPMSVTVEHKGDLYTLLVDSIGDVRSLPRNDFDKPPQTLDPRMRKLCSGVFRLNDDLLAVLDVERVLDPATIAEAPKRRPKPRKKAPAKAESAGSRGVSKSSSSPRKSEDAAERAPASEDTPSLFDRIGGELAVDAAVDLFYEKAGSDVRLSPFFATVDMDHQTSQMKAFLTQAFGGPAHYTGADMRKAHQRLVHQEGLDDGHFIAVAGHLADTLNQMGVPEDLIDEVMTVVESVRNDVLDR